MKEEGYEDAHNMCQQSGCIERTKHRVVMHYVFAYNIFSKECIIHCWLFAIILQLTFCMLTIDDMAMTNEPLRI